ncbi:hypothetical protein [Photobacterium sanguinicancri]|uniref:Uncharacterized protein n=1 Tax=Photobacterium sanguinicancri TaxID=875932 RepID=A0ABX4FTA2_9GAMM|nr:hypothetical protein [Photobacterium sanguinicancri]OZS42089.1 hypothetical protein ASV53_20280 [Photobacterium sanguinicancri]
MKFCIQVLLAALLSIVSSTQAACLLTAEKYVDVDIQVRSETVKGMKERLNLLQESANVDRMQKEDAKTLQRVQSIYDLAGCTPVEHSRYGVDNDADIALYLAFSSQHQQQIQAVQNAFDETTLAIRQLLPETVSLPTGVADNE